MKRKQTRIETLRTTRTPFDSLPNRNILQSHCCLSDSHDIPELVQRRPNCLTHRISGPLTQHEHHVVSCSGDLQRSLQGGCMRSLWTYGHHTDMRFQLRRGWDLGTAFFHSGGLACVWNGWCGATVHGGSTNLFGRFRNRRVSRGLREVMCLLASLMNKSNVRI